MQSFFVTVTVTLLLWTVQTCHYAGAFHPSQWRQNNGGGPPSRNSPRRRRRGGGNGGGGPSPHWYADDSSNAAATGSATASTASASSSTTTTTSPSSFQQRMLKQLQQHDSTTKRTQARTGKNKRSYGAHPSSTPALIEEVRTLADFQNIVTQGRSSGDSVESNHNHNDMILVWWYAPWCTACHALRPGMVALARRHAGHGLKVVSVACDETNTGLHQGLGAVPSVPYVHVYRRRRRSDDDNGMLELVEETKLNKKKLHVLHKTLQDYEDGSCSLERLGQWSVSCPYNFAYCNNDDAAVVGTTTTTTKKLAP